MGKDYITLKDIEYEVKLVKKQVRQANKGLPRKCCFDFAWRLIPQVTYVTLQIRYLDGEGVLQTHNVAM